MKLAFFIILKTLLKNLNNILSDTAANHFFFLIEATTHIFATDCLGDLTSPHVNAFFITLILPILKSKNFRKNYHLF